jgi:hypothetical protein
MRLEGLGWPIAGWAIVAAGPSRKPNLFLGMSANWRELAQTNGVLRCSGAEAGRKNFGRPVAQSFATNNRTFPDLFDFGLRSHFGLWGCQVRRLRTSG